jgi:AcrR family transcriptional regulator
VAAPKTAQKRAKPSPRRGPKKAEVRRVPTQERSKARLERILDAADAVFAAVGYERATTEEIAERAETSIGSLYQFYPNKKALFAALRTRYLERASELFEQLLTPEAVTRPWPELLDAVIDGFWRFHCDLPGFRAVWVHQNITAEMLAAGDVTNQVIAARAADVMGFFAPNVPTARRAAAASALVEMVSALLFVAVRREEAEASRLVEETKVMARAYLERVLSGTD